jgi:hypothetical protein
MIDIDILRQVRPRALELVESLSDEQLLIIPDGYRNNILWNFTHTIVTQQLLCYACSELPLHISDELRDQARKGTAPGDWKSPPDVAVVKAFHLNLVDQLAEDYQAGKFAAFKEYKTSAGVVLRHIDDAIAFNNFHEGLHLGVMMSLRKLVIA